MQRETLKLNGHGQWDAQLAALGEKVATQIGRDAVEASAGELRDAWKAGAPYDPKQRGAAAKYGHARDNITIGPVRNQNIHTVVFKVTTGDSFWLHFYELGSVRQVARPTFRPINERMKGRLVEVQIEHLNAGIEAAIGKGG